MRKKQKGTVLLCSVYTSICQWNLNNLITNEEKLELLRRLWTEFMTNDEVLKNCKETIQSYMTGNPE